MTITALILAAGRGTRAGEGLPKTYRDIHGEMVLTHTLRAFLTHPNVDAVRAVIHPDDQNLFEKACAALPNIEFTFGGATRAISVANGLDGIHTDKVLIHDGARPFISHDIISRVINALDDFDGAIPALPCTDALWQVSGQSLSAPLDRATIMRAQTPQGFHLNKYRPIATNYPDALDDAQIAVKAGLNVAWVEGDSQNVKLTYAEDFK